MVFSLHTKCTFLAAQLLYEYNIDSCRSKQRKVGYNDITPSQATVRVSALSKSASRKWRQPNHVLIKARATGNTRSTHWNLDQSIHMIAIFIDGLGLCCVALFPSNIDIKFCKRA